MFWLDRPQFLRHFRHKTLKTRVIPTFGAPFGKPVPAKNPGIPSDAGIALFALSGFPAPGQPQRLILPLQPLQQVHGVMLRPVGLIQKDLHRF